MKLSARTCLFRFLLLPLLFAGCIQEDLSDCPPVGIKVYFSYASTYAPKGINPAEVDRIDLFVFDEQGIFLSQWSDETPQLSPDYYITISSLPEGDYQFIAWGGMHECYAAAPAVFKVGQTTFAEAKLVLEHLSSDIPAGLHPLFHAAKISHIDPVREQMVVMPLVQNHNTINLSTEGLPSSGDTFRFTITDNNGQYNFDNSFAPDVNFNYTTLCGKDAQGQLQSTLTVLRLGADRHPQLTVYNETEGTVLFTEDLVKLINAAGTIDFATTHDFDIRLKFHTDASVDVMVNGWLVIENGEIILI